jgi:hypothetical protein
MIVAAHMLTNGEFYREPGPDYYTRHDPTKTKTRAVKQLEALGYDVTLQPLRKPDNHPPTSRHRGATSRGGQTRHYQVGH